MFAQRRVSVPTGFFGADLGDSATRSVDGRNFVEVAWRRPLGYGKAVKWRAYYDQFRYDGLYSYLDSSSYQDLDGAAGDWIGSQFLYQQEQTRLGSITAGADTNIDLRNLQYNVAVDSTPVGSVQEEKFLIRRRDANYAVFVQDEWKPAPAWIVYLGGRFDGSRDNPGVFSPRAVVVYKRNAATYKAMYGRAFRNPSTFERYWSPNPLLVAERIHSVELSREQQLGKSLRLLTSVFHYRLTGLIQGVPLTENSLQYQNRSKASATGVEVELTGHPFERLDTSVSYTAHRLRGIDDRHSIENSPARIAQFRAAVPFARERMVLAGVMRYVSSRLTAYDGITAPATTVFDLTATTRPTQGPMDLQFGVRNLFDNQYADPLSTEHASAVLQRAGRSVYVKLSWRME